MKSLGLFSQILTIALSVIIAVFYVQPTVLEIGQVQTETETYIEEREKVSSLNDKLQANLALVQAVSPEDNRKLAIYMPSSVDDISVMRDIEFMVNEAGLLFSDLSYDGEEDAVSAYDVSDVPGPALGDLAPSLHMFALTVSGEYDQIKDLLVLLETNEYPLEVHSFDLSQDELGSMGASMVLVTYSDDVINLAK